MTNANLYDIAKNLTLIYLQNKDLSEVSPNELCKMYENTYLEIKRYFKHKTQIYS